MDTEIIRHGRLILIAYGAVVHHCPESGEEAVVVIDNCYIAGSDEMAELVAELFLFFANKQAA